MHREVRDIEVRVAVPEVPVVSVVQVAHSDLPAVADPVVEVVLEVVLEVVEADNNSIIIILILKILRNEKAIYFHYGIVFALLSVLKTLNDVTAFTVPRIFKVRPVSRV